MLVRFPGSLRFRQVVAPLLVLTTLGLIALTPSVPKAAGLLALQWGAYAAALLLSGIERAVRRRDPALVWGVPAALLTIHLIWGVAFWWGILRGLGGSERGT